MNDKKLTPVEWDIMDVLWTLEKAASVRDVLETAYPNGEKAYTTIQTVMNILFKKKMLHREKIGLVNFYTPVYSREQMMDTELSGVRQRLFHGSIPAMANFLLNSENLSRDEIEKIRSLLDEKEKNLGE